MLSQQVSEEKKNQGVIPSTIMLTKTEFFKKMLRSFILTRHSTAEMLSVTDRNGRKCSQRPAICFAQCASQDRTVYAVPCHAGSSMGVLVIPWFWCSSLNDQLGILRFLPACPHLPLARSPHLQITRAHINPFHSCIMCSECKQDPGAFSSPSIGLAEESDWAALTFDRMHSVITAL